MIENYLWEQLVAVANYHTLSDAAKKLYVTQPALSRSMKKLEQIIGVELFKRRKNFIFGCGYEFGGKFGICI